MRSETAKKKFLWFRWHGTVESHTPYSPIGVKFGDTRNLKPHFSSLGAAVITFFYFLLPCEKLHSPLLRSIVLALHAPPYTKPRASATANIEVIRQQQNTHAPTEASKPESFMSRDGPPLLLYSRRRQRHVFQASRNKPSAHLRQQSEMGRDDEGR